jgi:RHS repeat-associated protein
MLNTRHIHKTDYIPSELTENYRLGYDNACRLIAVRHALNTQKEILMDSLVYDETGRVSKKILHGGIQTINYTYTIQNRLKSIDSEKFGETLYYQDSPYGNACYNGNIAAETFGAGDDKRYSFSYDQMNRLTGATNGSNGNFAEEVGSYDKNGNIKRIQRNGYVYDYSHNVTQGPIDDLTLNYNGNHLKSVSDATDQSTVITTNDFLDKQDEAHPDDAEYRFDANGNLTADLNKGVALIRYNLLNLPQKVQFQNGTKNEYLYDASGVKHRAGYNYSTATSLIPLGNTDPTKENNAPSTFQTDYCSNYVYEKTTAGGTPVLRRIITPEGYITTYGLTPMSYVGNWRAVYCMKDHQGNTRVNLTSDYLSNNTSKVYSASDQIDYYPFGMERSNTGQTSGGPFNSGANPYLYSGKETDRMNGLNEYDFSARWLDNAVPGFTTPDPLAELHCGESPYMYCGGDPVNRVDPTGLDYYSSGGKYYYIANCHETTPFTIKGVVYTWVGEDLFLTMEDGKKMYGDPQGHFHETGTVLSDVTTKPDNPSLNNLFVGKPDTPNFAGDKDGGGEQYGQINGFIIWGPGTSSAIDLPNSKYHESSVDGRQFGYPLGGDATNGAKYFYQLLKKLENLLDPIIHPYYNQTTTTLERIDVATVTKVEELNFQRVFYKWGDGTTGVFVNNENIDKKWGVNDTVLKKMANNTIDGHGTVIERDTTYGY